MRFSLRATASMVVTLDPMHDAHFTSMAELGFKSQLGKLDERHGIQQAS